jgi:chemotaxis protein MotB
MKKILVVSVMVVMFVLGIWLSEFVRNSVNLVLGHQVFRTVKDMEKELADCREKQDVVLGELAKKQKNLADFSKEINAKDYFTLTKESLLASSPSTDGKMGKILLRPPSSEMLFRSTVADDGSVRQIKEGLNEKIRTMLDVSKGILKEKLAMLNLELIGMNTRLREKNLELKENLAEVETYKQEVEKNKSYIQELEGIRTDLKKSMADLETKIENGRLRVSFKGDILFDSGSHRLKESGIRLLESVFPVLQKSLEKNDIFIAGHTDNVPIKKEFRNKYDSNWELSTYRAIEVVKYLTGRGLDPSNLTAAGYGEFKPVAENSTASGRAKNRRVELFVIPRIIQREG